MQNRYSRTNEIEDPVGELDTKIQPEEIAIVAPEIETKSDSPADTTTVVEDLPTTFQIVVKDLAMRTEQGVPQKKKNSIWKCAKQLAKECLRFFCWLCRVYRNLGDL